MKKRVKDHPDITERLTAAAKWLNDNNLPGRYAEYLANWSMRREALAVASFIERHEKKKPPRKRRSPRGYEQVTCEEPAQDHWAPQLNDVGFSATVRYVRGSDTHVVPGWTWHSCKDDSLLEGPDGEVLTIAELWRRCAIP